MQGFFFGAPPRRLYAAFHAADAAASVDAVQRAVLICSPHGQEGVRAHRLLRVLADRLARHGLSVLRFDPTGCGNSAGDDEALDWPGWLADTRAASAELARRTEGCPQVWIGARLGATVAVQAAAGSSPVRPPAALVLCEPVLDGPGWLRGLALATVAALEASCSIRDPAWRRRLAEDPASLEREGLGFAMGAPLHAALRALKPQDVAIPPGLAATVIRPGGPGAPAADAAAAVPGAVLREIDYAFDWTAEEALNTAIVPHPLLQGLVEASLGRVDGPAVPVSPGEAE